MLLKPRTGVYPLRRDCLSWCSACCLSEKGAYMARGLSPLKLKGRRSHFESIECSLSTAAASSLGNRPGEGTLEYGRSLQWHSLCTHVRYRLPTSSGSMRGTQSCYR